MRRGGQISQSVVRLWGGSRDMAGREEEGDRGQQGRGDAVVLFCPHRTGLAPVTTLSWTHRKAGRSAALTEVLQELQAFDCTRFQGPKP